jgi:hypothetical protein
VGEQLRRTVGQGAVLSADALASRLAELDDDGDGALRFEQLVTFFRAARLGGPFLCRVVAKGVRKTLEDRELRPLETFPVPDLARIVHSAMAAPPRPDRRYRIDPEALRGFEPLTDLEGNPIERRSPVSQVDPEPPASAPQAGGPSEPKPSSGPRPRSGPVPRKSSPGPRTSGPRTRARSGGPVPRRSGPKPRGS